MEIKFYPIPETDGAIKCTIHKNGKLGFSKGAEKLLGIDESKYIRIGRNVEDRQDTSLYVTVSESKVDDSLKINKAGKYYYLNTKTLFDSLSYQYDTQKIIYDISEVNINDSKFFKLKRRIKKR